MTQQLFKKLTTLLTTILRDTVEDDDASAVLDVWKTKRTEVNKALGVSRRKKVKDPNAPKRPKTSYILFCCELRDKVKEENENMSAKEITAELGRRWGKLTDKQKLKYQKKYEVEKVRYEKEMQNYSPPSDDELVKTSKRGRKKDPNSPKRPLSPYMFFCKDVRETVKEENPEMDGKQVTSELGKRWQKLTDKQKLKYQKLYNADKVRYEKEKAEYEAGKDTAKTVPAKSKSKAKAKAPAKAPAKAAAKSKAKAPAKGRVVETPGFLTFRDENSELSKRAVNTAWKKLSDEERQDYEDAAENDSESESEVSELSDEEAVAGEN